MFRNNQVLHIAALITLMCLCGVMIAGSEVSAETTLSLIHI